jgi:hypothetical protein
MTELCEIGFKYRTDKSPLVQHNYTPVYYEMFKDRRETVKKVVEMGIGYPESMFKVKNYITGASLYMWREFFPNAKIYGADIHRGALFTADRIKTYLCDETREKHIKDLIKKTGKDVDLFVDDGAHYREMQVYLCLTVMPLLKDDVIYSIEDVFSIQWVSRHIRMAGYKTVIPEMKGRHTYRDSMIIVTK